MIELRIEIDGRKLKQVEELGGGAKERERVGESQRGKLRCMTERLE